MNWLKKKKRFILMGSIIMLLSMTAGTTLAYVVAQAPSLMNLFIPGFESTGDVIVTKQIEHPFGSNYTLPELSFTFDASFGEDYANKTILSSDGQFTCDENGNYSFSLHAGASVEFYDLVSGTSVTITEHQDHTGFSTESKSQTVSVGRMNDTQISFINTYSPSSASSNLLVTGVKEISGRQWMEGDTFTFRLDMQKYGTDNSWTYLGEKTISYDPENAEYNRFDLSDLIPSFDSIGTYIFQLSEVSSHFTDMHADPKTFEVIVTDTDMDGYLEISDVKLDQQSIVLTDNQYVFDVTIINEFVPFEMEEILIQIHKELIDTSGQNMTPAGFTFSLYDETGALAAASAKTSSTGDTTIRLQYSAQDAGKEYTYLLKEDIGSLHGMKYDEKTVQLHVSVQENEDGTISAYVYDQKICEEVLTEQENENQESQNTQEITDENMESSPVIEPVITTVCRIPDEASDTYSVSFQNTYDPEDAHLIISGDKDIDGRTLDEHEFKFDLIYQGDVTDTVTHDQSGFFQFKELSFSQTGTFEYLVKENTSDLPGGVIGDSSEFKVIVKVDDVNGYLQASTKILDSNSNESNIKFTNHYSAEKAQIEFFGLKKLDGKQIEPEDFIFELYETDSSYSIGAVKESIYNNDEGQFKFSKIEFESEGTFYYVIKENSSKNPINGVKYDDSIYQIEVKIEDNRNGQLEAKTKMVRIKDSIQEEVSSILFENSYDAKDAVVTFSGLKKLNGSSIQEGMFSFYLYETNETFGYDPQSEPLKKATNDAVGNFSFDAITFSEEMTKYYVIVEKQDNKLDRVTYDDHIYEITVVVEDKNGVLEAQVNNADEILFVNTFVPKPTDLEIQIHAHKTVHNTGNQSIGPEGFQFMLEQRNSDSRSIMISDEQGNAVFTLIYSEEDAGKSFEYKLSEINDGKEHVTYSNETYDISVDILLENNQLKAILHVDQEETNEVFCEFENTYHKIVEQTPQKPANTGDFSKVPFYAFISIIALLISIMLTILRIKKLSHKHNR